MVVSNIAVVVTIFGNSLQLDLRVRQITRGHSSTRMTPSEPISKDQLRRVVARFAEGEPAEGSFAPSKPVRELYSRVQAYKT